MLKKHPITGSIISLKVKSHMQEFIMQLTLTKNGNANGMMVIFGETSDH